MREDIEFFTTNALYRFNSEVPKAGGAAPQHLFLPHLGHLLWYSIRHDRRDQALRSFFDLAGCGGSRSNPKLDVEFPAVP